MYEMKGALSGYGPGSAGFPASRLRVSQSPGLTVPDRLVSQPHRSRSTGRPASLFRFVRLPRTSPAPRAARRCQAPAANSGFPAFTSPRGKPPGWCPFPAVKVFLRPPPASRKSPPQFILGFFPVHTLSTEFRRLSARRSGYPPPYAQLLHRSPDVTQRIPAMIAHRNHSVFSRRPSVNPEFPPCRLPVRALARPPHPRPGRNAMDQHSHCVRTHWIRGSTALGRRGLSAARASQMQASAKPRRIQGPATPQLHPPVSGRRRPGTHRRMPRKIQLPGFRHRLTMDI